MQKSSKVVVIRCNDYAKANQAVEQAIEALGGLTLMPKERVLLKPNIVMGTSPDRAVCTHPNIMVGAVEAVLQAGGEPIVGESSGGPYTALWMNRMMNACGIAQAVTKAGATLNDDFSIDQVDFPEGKLLHNITLCHIASAIPTKINLCKLKTHSMMTYSGAVKNLFGLVPGTIKMELHARFPEMDRFAAQLNDIALCVGPTLHIMDGIVGMEGEGPTHGEPRQVGVVFASYDPWALDHVASGLIGLAPAKVPTLVDALERGLYDPESIELVGDSPEGLGCTFALPAARQNVKLSFGGPGITNMISKLTDVRPKVDKKTCIGCAVCANACPAKAIEMKDKLPAIDYKACIRCYCCQELCPHGAMLAKKSMLGRLLR